MSYFYLAQKKASFYYPIKYYPWHKRKPIIFMELFYFGKKESQLFLSLAQKSVDFYHWACLAIYILGHKYDPTTYNLNIERAALY